ncbi:MAG: hypothetical protein AAFQ64_19655 [Pseudomonadota bacterium]
MTDKTSTEPVVTFDGLKEAHDRPEPVDLRGNATAKRDRSAHRQHHWLYEDLLN